jgi:hypothetical protein
MNTIRSMLIALAFALCGHAWASGCDDGPYPGLLVPGNIDIATEGRFFRDDGTLGLIGMGVRRYGIEGEMLLPTQIKRGQHWSMSEAIREYRRTGRNCGIFDTIAHAEEHLARLNLGNAQVEGTKAAPNVAQLSEGDIDRLMGSESSDEPYHFDPDYQLGPSLPITSNPRGETPRPVDFKTLVLDGKALADEQAYVEVSGVYQGLGEVGMLWPPQHRAANSTDDSMPLLTEDSPREVREFLYDCRQRVAAAQGAGRFVVGCRVRITGHMTTCGLKIAPAAQSACLVVEQVVFDQR